MAQSKAKTVGEYLDELPADRRAELTRVRQVVRKRLPKGYVEAWRPRAGQAPSARSPS